jgi:anti-anti-sigma regulatory factor
MGEFEIKDGMLTIDGEMTISKVNEVKETLLKAIESPNPVMLNLGGVTETDVPFIQLIISASIYADSLKKEFKIKNPSTEFLQVVERSGFSHYLKPLIA